MPLQLSVICCLVLPLRTLTLLHVHVLRYRLSDILGLLVYLSTIVYWLVVVLILLLGLLLLVISQLSFLKELIQLLLLGNGRYRSTSGELLTNLVRVPATDQWIVIASSAHFEVAIISIFLKFFTWEVILIVLLIVAALMVYVAGNLRWAIVWIYDWD